VASSDGVDDHEDGDVLAAGVDRLHGFGEGGRAGFARGEDVVERAAELAGQVGFRLGARGAHGDAGVAQAADDGFRGLDAVVDDQHSQHAVLFDSHPPLSFVRHAPIDPVGWNRFPFGDEWMLLWHEWTA
jgi:hypothetical protein